MMLFSPHEIFLWAYACVCVLLCTFVPVTGNIRVPTMGSVGPYVDDHVKLLGGGPLRRSKKLHLRDLTPHPQWEVVPAGSEQTQ